MRRNRNTRWIEFRTFWKQYILQSLLAGLSLSIILISLSFQNLVIVASMASSIFIIFAMPNSVTAKARSIIGGHLICLIVGSLCGIIPHSTQFLTIMVYSLAVGLSMLIMTVSDTEHPPASGTALGVAISGFTWNLALAILIATVVLSLIHRFCRRYIKDLL